MPWRHSAIQSSPAITERWISVHRRLEAVKDAYGLSLEQICTKIPYHSDALFDNCRRGAFGNSPLDIFIKGAASFMKFRGFANERPLYATSWGDKIVVFYGTEEEICNKLDESLSVIEILRKEAKNLRKAKRWWRHES